MIPFPSPFRRDLASLHALCLFLVSFQLLVLRLTGTPTTPQKLVEEEQAAARERERQRRIQERERLRQQHAEQTAAKLKHFEEVSQCFFFLFI